MKRIAFLMFCCGGMLLDVAQVYAGTDTLTLDLYEHLVAVDRGKETEQVKYNEAGQLTHISSVVRPRLQVYRPSHPTGTSVLICPGGGYTKLNVENPGVLANQLTEYGVTVFVLVYRLPADQRIPVTKEFEALEDVRAALKLIKQKTAEWQYPSTKTVLWGSSAGAHLAAMAATARNYQQIDPLDEVRPDYLVLTFPVLSFRPEIAKKYQAIGELLFGEKPSESDIHQFSPAELVTAETPPTFLVHADDDPIISPLNSILFYQALHREKVNAELHVHNHGGHGFGFRMDEKNEWMNQLIRWLGDQRLL